MSSVTDVAPVAATRTPEGRPRRPRKPRSGALLALAAWLIGFLFVVPVLWMVLTSFHSEEAAATNPPSVFAPLTIEGRASAIGRACAASSITSTGMTGASCMMESMPLIRRTLSQRQRRRRRGPAAGG